MKKYLELSYTFKILIGNPKNVQFYDSFQQKNPHLILPKKDTTFYLNSNKYFNLKYIFLKKSC